MIALQAFLWVALAVASALAGWVLASLVHYGILDAIAETFKLLAFRFAGVKFK
jgi:hypothetical protein